MTTVVSNTFSAGATLLTATTATLGVAALAIAGAGLIGGLSEYHDNEADTNDSSTSIVDLVMSGDDGLPSHELPSAPDVFIPSIDPTPANPDSPVLQASGTQPGASTDGGTTTDDGQGGTDPDPVITEPDPVITEPDPVITDPDPVITDPVITEPDPEDPDASLLFKENGHFGTTVSGAQILSCDPTDKDCQKALKFNGNALKDELNNDAWVMSEVNSEGGNTNSASTVLTIPEDANVRVAYVVWSANRGPSDELYG